MVKQNTARLGTAFCVTIEAKHSTSTGISAADRAQHGPAPPSIRGRKPSDLARPGHMFPLRARNRRRAGARRADRSGGRSRADRRAVSRRRHLRNHERRRHRWRACRELTKFAKQHKLLMITIADLIQYRMHDERW